MSKYNKGDKFELEIAEVFIGETDKEIYRVKGFAALTFDEAGLGRLRKIKSAESEVDWSKVSVDTPILVRNSAEQPWRMVYFAGYKDGKVSAWYGGRTSWNECMISSWNCAKLAKVEE